MPCALPIALTTAYGSDAGLILQAPTGYEVVPALAAQIICIQSQTKSCTEGLHIAKRRHANGSLVNLYRCAPVSASKPSRSSRFSTLPMVLRGNSSTK